MPEKFTWRKAWLSAWRDAASARLDMCSTLLRQWMNQNATDPSEDGTGWLVDEDGDPVPLEVMARECFATLEQIEAALERLVKAKVAVELDGRWGVRGWQKTQESPEAARQRRCRAAPRVTVPPSVTPPVTPVRDEAVTTAARGGEEQRTEEQNSPPPSAGGREDSPPPAVIAPGHTRKLSAAPATLGQRLALARELVGTLTATTAASLARIARGRYAQLEADEALPTRDELARIATTLGQPEIASWPLPERDPDLVEAVVRQHRDLAVELGALDPSLGREPLVVSPHDVAAVYAAEVTDAAAGLELGAAWRRVLDRAGEELRRDIARGRLDQRRWFTLQHLAREKRRNALLVALDLDRRDDTTPAARGSPRGRRGPAPPQNPDRLTDGEIPT